MKLELRLYKGIIDSIESGEKTIELRSCVPGRGYIGERVPNLNIKGGDTITFKSARRSLTKETAAVNVSPPEILTIGFLLCWTKIVFQKLFRRS